MAPYRFERTASAAELQERYADLAAATETGDVVAVAGRLVLRRVQGKLAFGTLQDGSGRVQLFATKQSTPDYDAFCDLSLGDWIGVRGQVMTTKRGELSVQVGEWVLLAEARRQFPDKWHGIADTDTRYRQRYVDLWVTDEAAASSRPAASSRWRRPSSTRCRAVPTPSPSSPTTTRSTWSCTSASRPSCT
jgi:lysyl-tRNA synthetase class 2